jgi:hypothetical protein
MKPRFHSRIAKRVARLRGVGGGARMFLRQTIRKKDGKEHRYFSVVENKRRLHALAPGLTPRSVLEKFSAIQMIDVHVPTTDGRELVLTRHTEPQPELRLLLDKLRLELPAQPAPKITAETPRPQATV